MHTVVSVYGEYLLYIIEGKGKMKQHNFFCLYLLEGKIKPVIWMNENILMYEINQIDVHTLVSVYGGYLLYMIEGKMKQRTIIFLYVIVRYQHAY